MMIFFFWFALPFSSSWKDHPPVCITDIVLRFVFVCSCWFLSATWSIPLFPPVIPSSPPPLSLPPFLPLCLFTFVRKTITTKNNDDITDMFQIKSQLSFYFTCLDCCLFFFVLLLFYFFFRFIFLLQQRKTMNHLLLYIKHKLLQCNFFVEYILITMTSPLRRFNRVGFSQRLFQCGTVEENK